MGTIGGGIRASTIHLLLALLRLELLLLLHSLLLVGLLSLDGGEQVMRLEVFRVVMADTLFLHLLEFLRDNEVSMSGYDGCQGSSEGCAATTHLKNLLDVLLRQVRRQAHVARRHVRRRLQGSHI